MSFWDSLTGQNHYNIQSPTLAKPSSDIATAGNSRAQQQSLSDALRAASRGQGPSVADEELRRAQQQAMMNAKSMAAGASGPTAGLAQRNAMFAGAQSAQAAGSAAALARAQEAQKAQALLAQNLQSQRAGDIQGRQMTDQENQALMNAQLQTDRLRYQQSAANSAGTQNFYGGLMAAGGTMLAMSDIRSKEDIQSSDRELKDKLDAASQRTIAGLRSEAALPNEPAHTARFDTMSPDESRRALDPLDAYTYRYREPDAARMAERFPPEGQGEAFADYRSPRTGVMAQDLEQSPEGRQVVVDTPHGKGLDQERALSFALASNAALNKRIEALENKQGR